VGKGNFETLSLPFGKRKLRDLGAGVDPLGMGPVAANKDCPVCHGVGNIIVHKGGEAKMQECWCLYNKRVIAKLGPELAQAKPARDDSPLYIPHVEHGGPPVVDKTRINLLLKGWWTDLLCHFKWTFIAKWGTVKVEGFNFQIITDEKLKNVWFGRESVTSRTRKQRDEVATYNTVEDLIGSTYHLAIIRLGFLGWKNQAMGGILKEALMVRQSLNLPTWLVEEPDSPFGEGHYTWSRDVGDYIQGKFEVIDLVKERSGQVEYRGVVGARPREEPGMTIDKDDEEPVAVVRKAPRAPISDRPSHVDSDAHQPSERDSVLSGPGYPKNKYGKKKQGGGPLG